MTASSKSPPKNSPFSRFIPREEIDAVSAWRFASVDGSDKAAVREDAAPAPEPETAPPSLLLENVVAEARRQAYADGFAHGHDVGGKEVHEALEAAMRRSAEEAGVRLGLLIHGMTDQLIGCEQQIARQILELACDIARQVVRQELQSNTGHLRAVIGEALELIVEDGLPATVRMHPDDLALMKDALMNTLGKNAPAFVADVAISPGGCLVQTPGSVVDATIEKRWSRAVGNLGLELPWHPEDTDV